MSSIFKPVVFATCGFALLASVNASAEKLSTPMAERQVEEYHALRKLCTVKKFEEKRSCFSELRKMTEQYLTAREYLSSAREKSKLALQ